MSFFGLIACGGGNQSSSSPNSPTGPTPPAPSTTANLSGRVTETGGGSTIAVEGTTLRILDGGNSGRSATTNSSGDYQFSGLHRGGFTVEIVANGYQTQGFGIELAGDLTRNFTLTPSGPRTRFAAGTHRIGTDIASGRYFTDPSTDSCYWERLRGFSGTLSDVIANDFVGYNPMQYIVDLMPSDVAFKPDSDCGTWFKDSPRHPAQSTIPPGVWLVGSQIAPGTYQISSGAGCYWERLRNFEHVLGSIIANEFESAPTTQMVTISPRDVGFHNDGDCGTWTRTAALTPGEDAADPQQSPQDIEENWQEFRRKIARRR
jgi:hypothetical protein